MRSPLTLSLLPRAGEGGGSGSGSGVGGQQPDGRATSRGASCSTIAINGVTEDPDDPLALLERADCRRVVHAMEGARVLKRRARAEERDDGGL